MAARCPRKAVVVLAGASWSGDRAARAVVASLVDLGVEVVYAGREHSAHRIAAIVADARADAVELCLAEGAGVGLLRQLLRELIGIGRREVSIVVHKVH